MQSSSNSIQRRTLDRLKNNSGRKAEPFTTIDPLVQLVERLFVFTSDQPGMGELVLCALHQLPNARRLVGPGYNALPWSDIASEHATLLAGALIEFLHSNRLAPGIRFQ
jgi:hypothetical protein